MPLVAFSDLPDDARVWVFGSTAALDPDAERALLAEVDAYLDQWKAHGAPLTAGRDWREHHFLTVAVDSGRENASGCSIDGLFQALQRLESRLGTSLVGGGRVFFRDASGAVAVVDRAGFSERAERGDVSPETAVFDTTVPTLADWRSRFETTARHSWHGALLPVAS